ncbi:MAG TPA: FAD/NAD(P)-binding protein [Acidimicrobiales bacterium]|nr:FAD/NAD(P)-binding protein [Acidimicrobiales bacterium]
MPNRADRAPLEVALVGAGPTAASLFERLVANIPELLPDRALRIHLVDPHRAGTGRVWRPDQHPLLWMNSMAEDVTLFVDDSVECKGPAVDGPNLHEWARSIDDEELRALATSELYDEIRALDEMSFPTRRVQSVYLDWFFGRLVASLPPDVEVATHMAAAIDMFDAGERQTVVLDDGSQIDVDIVVLSLGHLDALPDDTAAELSGFAADHGLAYVPCGHTAEQDLSVLTPGADVLVLGMGQAFTDLLVLVTEGRGGRFVEQAGGSLAYEPSGLEPVLHAGSRRGVPYRSKLPYRLQAPLAPLPHFLDGAAITRLQTSETPLDFFVDVLPLVAKEIGWAYYHELFAAHPERTTTTWDAFAPRYEAAPWGSELDALLTECVPDPDDHFDIAALDQPLAGVRFATGEALHRYVTEHVAADITRRTDTAHSPDLAAFTAMLGMAEPLRRIAHRVTPRSRLEGISTWWLSFFMYYASGPPPERLRQLLALVDAGLVRFVGADMRVHFDASEGVFAATSSSHPDVVRGTAVIDARIARPSVSRSTSVLIRRLHVRGEIVEDVVVDEDWAMNTGRVSVTGPALNLLRHDGTGHPRRHALGAFTNRQVAGAFARPRFNAPAFRQNDAVARAVLTTLAAVVG